MVAEMARAQAAAATGGSTSGRPCVLVVAIADSPVLAACLDQLGRQYCVHLATCRHDSASLANKYEWVDIHPLDPRTFNSPRRFRRLVRWLNAASVVSVESRSVESKDAVRLTGRTIAGAGECAPVFEFADGTFRLISNGRAERWTLVLAVYAACWGLMGLCLHLAVGWLAWPALVIAGLVGQMVLPAVVEKAHWPQKEERTRRELGRLRRVDDYHSLSPLYVLGHPVFGWTHGSGVDMTRRYVRDEREYHYRVQTDTHGHRRTSEHDPRGSRSSQRIAMLGCSYTFGAGVNDNETYAWRAQAALSAYEVTNYGCCGYSLFQMLLVLEELLRETRPNVVTLGFHPSLAKRITWTAAEVRSLFSDGKRFPFCRLKRGRLWRCGPTGYCHVPGSCKDVLLKWLEEGLNRLRFTRDRRTKVMRRTNEYLLLAMKGLCEAHGARFLVVCLDDCPEYYSFFSDQDFTWVATSVRVWNSLNSSWTLYPFDSHPNQRAHAAWGSRLAEVLPSVMCGGRPEPGISDVGRMDEEEEEFQLNENIYPLY